MVQIVDQIGRWLRKEFKKYSVVKGTNDWRIGYPWIYPVLHNDTISAKGGQRPDP